MAGILNRLFGQDIADQQVIPVTFRWLSDALVGNPDQPGQWSPFLSGENGALFVALLGGSGMPILLPDNDDDVPVTADNDRLPTVARLYGLDGTTNSDWDRLRTDDDDINASDAESLPALRTMGRNRLYNNFDDQWIRESGQGAVALLASAARTVETIGATQVNANWRAAHYILDITAIGATTITVNIEGRNLTTLAWYPLLTSAAIGATGVVVLKVGIGFTPVANLTANDLIPYITRVRITPSNATAVTYSFAINYSV